MIPFLPPSVQGLGNFGGFEYVLQDQGGHSLEDLFQVTQQVVREGNADPDLGGLFTSFTASDPQLVVTIDREKAKALDVPLEEITQTLQVYVGSAYVNDFDFNNRAYRVYVQADSRFRSNPSDLRQYYVRSRTGRMLPIADLVEVRRDATPQVISHYNLFRSADINGTPPPAAARATRSRPWRRVSARGVLPQGFGYEWTGISREEIEAGAAVGAPLPPRRTRRVPGPVRAVRELRAAVHRAAGGADGTPRARWAPSGCAASRTTSTARSGSSCSWAWPARTRS